MRNPNYSLRTGLALIACAGLTAGAAHADEKIVSEVSISGLPAATAAQAQVPALDKPVTSTTYFKSGLWRTEVGGTVMLAGAPDGKMYSLDTAAKTYYVMATGAAASDALANNPILAMLKFKTKADVHPAGETKTIAGKTASSYKYSATVHISMGDGDDPSTDAMMPTVRITGEKWTSEALNLPVSPFGTGSLSKLMPGPLGNGFKDLTAKLGEIKGYPLLDTETINVVFPQGSPFAAMAGDSMPTKITVKQMVTSISDAPLADDLFHVPADFKLVDAPAPPSPQLPGAPATNPPATTPPATNPPPAK